MVVTTEFRWEFRRLCEVRRIVGENRLQDVKLGRRTFVPETTFEKMSVRCVSDERWGRRRRASILGDAACQRSKACVLRTDYTVLTPVTAQQPLVDPGRERVKFSWRYLQMGNAGLADADQKSWPLVGCIKRVASFTVCAVLSPAGRLQCRFGQLCRERVWRDEGCVVLEAEETSFLVPRKGGQTQGIPAHLGRGIGKWSGGPSAYVLCIHARVES